MLREVHPDEGVSLSGSGSGRVSSSWKINDSLSSGLLMRSEGIMRELCSGRTTIVGREEVNGGGSGGGYSS